MGDVGLGELGNGELAGAQELKLMAGGVEDELAHRLAPVPPAGAGGAVGGAVSAGVEGRGW